jgi:hypothetical protein
LLKGSALLYSIAKRPGLHLAYVCEREINAHEFFY